MPSKDRPTFRLPDPEAWKTLISDLKLDATQAHELGLLLQHVDADLQAFAEQTPTPDDRRELVDALKAFSKAIGRLETVLHDHLPELSDALPHASTAAIGDMLTLGEIESVLNKRLTITNLEKLSGREFEAGTAFARQAQGVAAGPELFSHFLRRVHKPVENWLEENKSNSGGRPPDQMRRHLITMLAKNSKALIGEPPTSSGEFIRLCTEVVGQCGLETIGLRDAVERILGVRER